MGDSILRSLLLRQFVPLVDIFYNIGQITLQDLTQGIQRIGRYGLPGLQPPDRRAADLALDLERISGGVLFGHGVPQRRI